MVRFFGWDEYGLPIRDWGFTAAQRTASWRNSDPMVRLIRNPRSILYDAVVSLLLEILVKKRIDSEDTKQVLDWSVNYSIDPDEWPAGAIARRLARVCRPGPIRDDEAEDLKLLLDDLAGDPDPIIAEPTAIPFTDPPPRIQFANKQFVFTGHFVYGVAACIEVLWLQGGAPGETVTALTDYLVVGALRSQEWVENSIRTDVERVLAQNCQVGPVAKQTAIISEESFLHAIYAANSQVGF